ncbi:hypothetical protein QUG92_11315 [Curtobacterium sp. RHCKG23]|uniref:Transcriptional regulator, AbiEi antitoxin, Type IV TA system n=1 Tax=Curtobacterium citri TaxID=3055139 RepID=A0ABT7T812_9MICO|nr:hypothetical protein [Curtobacterium citri]MDM7885693.1 hypothetical protein [Curtobacterium citri]
MTEADDIDLVRTAHLPSAERRALERATARGEYERIRPGVLVRRGSTTGLRPDQRHVLLVRASLPRLRPQDRLSHESACAVLGLPVVGSWPSRVHVADPTADGTRVSAWFVRHGVAGRPPSDHRDHRGLPTTSPARTAVDIASSRPLLLALPVLDHVLRWRCATTEDLGREVGLLGPKGRSKAASAVAMGSPRSDSPAESMCRVRFRLLGTPEPEQQHVFSRPGERTAVVDFWFPDHGVVVEVDGRAKYGTAAADVAAAHWQEKQREDFVRSFPEVRTVVRVVWTDLVEPERLRAKLLRAGVPCS